MSRDKKLKMELEILQNRAGRQRPGYTELEIMENLKELYFREDIMWKQPSRVQWLTEGDKNTRFYHLRPSKSTYE